MDKRTTHIRPAAGTYGTGAKVPSITVDGLGRIASVVERDIDSDQPGVLDTSRKLSFLSYVAGSTVTNTLGGMTPTTLGGAPSAFTTAPDNGARFTTGATSGNINGISSSQVLTNFGRAFDEGHRFYAGNDITSQRVWVGLFSGDPTASDTPAVHIAGFRYSTGAGDTKWQCVTKDGATATTTDSGVTVSANAAYRLRVVADAVANTVKFYVNGSLVATHSTNLPASGTNLTVYMAITTLTNATRRIDIVGMTLVDKFA